MQIINVKNFLKNFFKKLVGFNRAEEKVSKPLTMEFHREFVSTTPKAVPVVIPRDEAAVIKNKRGERI